MSLLGKEMDKISIDSYPSQPIGINIHIQITEYSYSDNTFSWWFLEQFGRWVSTEVNQLFKYMIFEGATSDSNYNTRQ